MTVRSDVGSPPPAAPADPDFDRLPPVARALGRGEWGAIAAVGALLAVSALDADVRALEQTGARAAYWQTALVALAGAALWVAAVPWVFAALDRTPVRRGRRARHVLLRLLLAIGATAAHGAAARTAVSVAGPPLGLHPAVVAAARAAWRPPLGGSFDGFLALLLAHAVVQRVHRSRYRQRRAAELEGSLARARLDALSSQLEPHFLFNTLNGIAALVRDDPAVAEAMLVKLGDMLRLTLDGAGTPEITLRAELARLALYVDLQRMRFGPRLTVRWAVADDVLDALVPGMLLQPIVENALIHGVGPVPGPGTIEIAAHGVGGRIRLTVRDTGAGLPPGAAAHERTGVGNTRARLATLYGRSARFELGAPPAGGGTLVTVEIPRRAPAPVASADDPGDAAPPAARAGGSAAGRGR